LSIIVDGSYSLLLLEHGSRGRLVVRIRIENVGVAVKDVAVSLLQILLLIQCVWKSSSAVRSSESIGHQVPILELAMMILVSVFVDALRGKLSRQPPRNIVLVLRTGSGFFFVFKSQLFWFQSEPPVIGGGFFVQYKNLLCYQRFSVDFLCLDVGSCSAAAGDASKPLASGVALRGRIVFQWIFFVFNNFGIQ